MLTIIYRIERKLNPRWFQTGIQTLRKLSSDSGYKPKWKIYWSDLVIKNLRPDKVETHYKMVYRSSLETYVNFCILAGSVCVISSPFLIRTVWKSFEDESGWTWKKLEGIGGLAALTASVAILYMMTLRCPLRMYYSEVKDHYLVFMPRVIPYKSSSMVLKPGSVKPPDPSYKSFLPWNQLVYTVRETNTKMVIVDSSFSLPMYYNRLMGY